MTVYSQKEIQWKIVSLGRKNRQKRFARTRLMPLSIFRKKIRRKKEAVTSGLKAKEIVRKSEQFASEIAHPCEKSFPSLRVSHL